MTNGIFGLVVIRQIMGIGGMKMAVPCEEVEIREALADGGITTEEVGTGVSLAEGMQSFLGFGSSEGLGKTLQVAKTPSTFTRFEVVAFGGRRKLMQNPLLEKGTAGGLVVEDAVESSLDPLPVGKFMTEVLMTRPAREFLQGSQETGEDRSGIDRRMGK